jgi:4-hydroxy-3-methylbut-2-enyl diphosphate reductase
LKRLRIPLNNAIIFRLYSGMKCVGIGMEVIRAKSAGFCMGVSLALRKLDDVIEHQREPGHIYILGSIIHNPQVVREYAELGVHSVASPEEIPREATVVVRAHGITRQVEQALVERGVEIIDATCPKVKAACIKIQRCTAAGQTLLLYGEEHHPEVRCLLSYAGGATSVFDSFETFSKQGLISGCSYCLAAQTTQDRSIFERIIADLRANDAIDISIQNTICDATRCRQGEAVDLARKVDYFIVAGGYNSSNTKRLAQVVEAQGTGALHIEMADELPLERLRQYSKVGLTAGASTPNKIIDEIEQVLKSL